MQIPLIYLALGGVLLYVTIGTILAYKKSTRLIKDPYYEKYIKTEAQLELYNYFIKRILMLEGVHEAEKRNDISVSVDKKILSIIEEAKNEDLNEDVLIVMLYQYLYADVMLRGLGKNWAYAVTAGNDPAKSIAGSNYFPSTGTVIKGLLENKKL